MICSIHNIETVTYLRGKGKNVCPKCNTERITAQRRKNKIALVQYFGSKCIKCGYCKNISGLTFHHRDPTEKEFGIGGGDTKSFLKLLEEAKKCDLLCRNCHAEEHSRPEDFSWNDTLVKIVPNEVVKAQCGVCPNKVKRKGGKYCSYKCFLKRND